MDSSDNAVPSQAVKAGKVLVGNEKANGQAVPRNSWRPVTGLDWRDIFAKRPDLIPPGYEEAAEASREKLRQRRLAELQALQDKKASKSPPKSKSRRKR
jgi:hypothetical protein